MSNPGSYIRETRKRLGISLRSLADITGISHTEIARIERGERESPGPETLKKLSEGLFLDYEWLMDKYGYLTGIERDPNKRDPNQLKDLSQLIGNGIDIDKINEYTILYKGKEVSDSEKKMIKEFVRMIKENK